MDKYTTSSLYSFHDIGKKMELRKIRQSQITKKEHEIPPGPGKYK